MAFAAAGRRLLLVQRRVGTVSSFSSSSARTRSSSSLGGLVAASPPRNFGFFSGYSPSCISNFRYNNKFAAAGCRHISQIVKPNGQLSFLFEASDLVRLLESQGVPSKQAEATTATIVQVLNDSLESASEETRDWYKIRRDIEYMKQKLVTDRAYKAAKHEEEKCELIGRACMVIYAFLVMAIILCP